jgi:hypothetical protein
MGASTPAAGRGRDCPCSDLRFQLWFRRTQDLLRACRAIARFFVDHDVWLTPTLGSPPVPLGTLVYKGGDPFEA